jgi:hypothetical protein
MPPFVRVKQRLAWPKSSRAELRKAPFRSSVMLKASWLTMWSMPYDTVTAISVFNNYAGAEEANRRALAWIEQNLAPLLVGPATAVAGPVIVHTLA